VIPWSETITVERKPEPIKESPSMNQRVVDMGRDYLNSFLPSAPARKVVSR